MYNSRRSSLVLLSALALALLVATVAAASVTFNPTLASRQDLAQRLGLDLANITVDKTEPVTWPSGALGLQQPDMLYTMALVPGLRLELLTPGGRYYYHTGGNVVKYAGRAESWNSSALYVEPVENEPNLNGNLTQISLLGTNEQQILSQVTDFAPQADGSILATRRTSRSGFDLVYLPPKAHGAGTVVDSAFEFASPVLKPGGGEFAVFHRVTLGTEWQVDRSSLDGRKPLVLPDLPVQGQPYKLIWPKDGGLEAIVKTDQGLQGFTLAADGKSWGPAQTVPDPGPGLSVVLNKSWTLNIFMTAAQPGGHPVTRVERERFDGLHATLADISDLTLEQAEVTPAHDFALLVGQQNGTRKACTVDLMTGEILWTLPSVDSPVHLFTRPAHWEPPIR